jgi:cytochrome c-type biogenesis protein CcmH
VKRFRAAITLGLMLAALPVCTMALSSAPLAAQTPADSNSAHAGSEPGGAGTPIPAVSPAGPAMVPVGQDTAFDNRARMVNMQLRCPVCQGASIQESPSAEATAMKEIVRERLSAGESEDEIKAYFVSRYGDWILLAPPAHGINILVYILPVVLLAAGGFFVYRTAKSWTNAAA